MNPQIKQRLDAIARGEIPEGYKKIDEIGYVPSEWREGAMSDVLTHEPRPVPKPNEAYWRLGVRSHAKGTFHELVADPNAVEMEELFEVKKNDLIINITFAWEHAVALVDEDDEGKFVSHRFPTYVFNASSDPDFYKSVVKQKWFKYQLANISPGGAGRNRVMSKTAFLRVPCYIPPLPEQQKIASILAHCDNVIELKQELIDELHRRKKWLMQMLLDPDSGVRLPGFDGAWKESKFADLFEFGSSISASREQLGNEGICYLHYGDIHSNDKYYIDVEANFSDIPKLDCSKRSINKNVLINDGDIVFVDASEDYEGTSKYVVVKNTSKLPFIAGLHTIVAHGKNGELCLLFKRYCCQSNKVVNQIKFYATGMKVLGINKNNIGKVVLDFPTLPEQAAIANILSVADNEISLHEQELNEWRKKKKSLMQLLLTGIVRVFDFRERR